MSGSITVTGGTNNTPVNLGNITNTNATINSQILGTVQSVNDTYSSTTTQTTTSPTLTPSQSDEVIVPDSQSGTTQNASGFGAIVIQNNSGADTVVGGGVTGNQTVLSSTGGLTFTVAPGSKSNIVLDAGGGSNYISFAGDSPVTTNAPGQDVGDTAILGGGNDTVVGADSGITNVVGGFGYNSVIGGGGDLNVNIEGHDSVQLSAGAATIYVDPSSINASVVVQGSTATPTYNQYGNSLTFIGGDAASTVLGGTGRYDITLSVGGGEFTGGSEGGNVITGGIGPVTITSGGVGDYLTGGNTGSNLLTANSDKDTLVAGLGNTTLVGNATNTDFSLANAANTTATYTVEGFNVGAGDFLSLGTQANVNAALANYTVSNGSGTIALDDGSKIILQGYTGSLSGHIGT